MRDMKSHTEILSMELTDAKAYLRWWEVLLKILKNVEIYQEEVDKQTYWQDTEVYLKG